MTIIDIIEKKKNGQALNKNEINFFVEGYLNDTIPDYQMSALLMAIYFQKMNDEEIVNLTNAYVASGKTYDLSGVKGFKADKHSTGGIGDKTTLIHSPLVASYGIKVCKIAGRGLGKTGGTIDKLESFPNWNPNLSVDEFIKVVNKVGMSIITQSKDLVPGDKKIYSLRDVTATVDSMPLIAASVMSKKLAIDCDGLVLDVKVGDGAFMKTLKEAEELAMEMIKIGHANNRQTAALLTNMNKPLGRTIGNALEVHEAWETLNGHGPEDLNDVVITATALTLLQAKIFVDFELAKKDAEERLKKGIAAPIFKEFVEAQGGNFDVLNDYDKYFPTITKIDITASNSGYVHYIKTDELGFLAAKLGAGREVKNEPIDFAAGIHLNKGENEYADQDEVIMTLYSNRAKDPEWITLANETFEINQKPSHEKDIMKIIY